VACEDNRAPLQTLSPQLLTGYDNDLFGAIIYIRSIVTVDRYLLYNVCIYIRYDWLTAGGRRSLLFMYGTPLTVSYGPREKIAPLLLLVVLISCMAMGKCLI
jgi:hypothetical protein